MTARRAAAWLALATTIVAGTLVLRSLGESAAQLRSTLEAVAAIANESSRAEPRRVDAVQRPVARAPAPSATAPSAAAPSATAPVGESLLEPTTLLGTRASEPVAAAGPPSGAEFAELLESGLLGEDDPEAAAELRRTLEDEAP